MNADLLDGLTMIDSNWSSGASIMGRDSNGSTKVNVITASSFAGGSGSFPNGITGADATITGTNSISNLTVSGSFNAASGTNFGGNASTATLAANIEIGANRVPYNSANNSTTSSSNLEFNGTTLTVNALTVSNTISGSINGNSATSSTVNVTSASSGTYNLIMSNSGAGNATMFRDGGISFNASSNALTVNGDITALASDMRLKTSLEQIEGAVAKVCKLSGFTYEFNETGKGLNLPSGRHAGVSAQQVQEVLPEAVAERPIDQYLTVKYDKLVPLLIEAIKELKAEIEDIKNGRT